MASTISASPVVITYQTIPLVAPTPKPIPPPPPPKPLTLPVPVPVPTPTAPKTDCVEGYQTTGTCTNGKNLQTWVVSQQPTKDGKPCATPTPPTQKPIDCTDCVGEWGQWGPCVNGQQ